MLSQLQIPTHLIATHRPPTQTRYQTRKPTNPQRGQNRIPNTKEQTNPPFKSNQIPPSKTAKMVQPRMVSQTPTKLKREKPHQSPALKLTSPTRSSQRRMRHPPMMRMKSVVRIRRRLTGSVGCISARLCLTSS